MTECVDLLSETPADDWSLEQLSSFCVQAFRRTGMDSWKLGKALSIARDKHKEDRSWMEWLATTKISRSSAYRFMDIAKHCQLSDAEGKSQLELLELVAERKQPTLKIKQGTSVSECDGEGIQVGPKAASVDTKAVPVIGGRSILKMEPATKTAPPKAQAKEPALSIGNTPKRYSWEQPDREAEQTISECIRDLLDALEAWEEIEAEGQRRLAKNLTGLRGAIDEVLRDVAV